jgi:hypothetical protein
MRPGLALAEARGTTRIPCVASLTGGRTTVITTRPFRDRLCCSIAMRTGNGRYDYAIREESHIHIISRASWILIFLRP